MDSRINSFDAEAYTRNLDELPRFLLLEAGDLELQRVRSQKSKASASSSAEILRKCEQS